MEMVGPGHVAAATRSSLSLFAPASLLYIDAYTSSTTSTVTIYLLRRLSHHSLRPRLHLTTVSAVIFIYASTVTLFLLFRRLQLSNVSTVILYLLRRRLHVIYYVDGYTSVYYIGIYTTQRVYDYTYLVR